MVNDVNGDPVRGEDQRMTGRDTVATIDLTDDEWLLMAQAINEYWGPAGNAKLLIGPIFGVKNSAQMGRAVATAIRRARRSSAADRPRLGTRPVPHRDFDRQRPRRRETRFRDDGGRQRRLRCTAINSKSKSAVMHDSVSCWRTRIAGYLNPGTPKTPAQTRTTPVILSAYGAGATVKPVMSD